MEAVFPTRLESLMRALRRVIPLLLTVPLVSIVPGTVAAGLPRCDGRAATVVGTHGADKLSGTMRADVIVGLGGDDTIDGLGGDDVICGGPGADRLVGGGGDDRLFGGLDKEVDGPGGTYLVGDVLAGGAGDDRLDGGRDTRRVDHRRRPDTYSWAGAPRRVVIDLSGRKQAGFGSARGEGSDTIVLGAAHGVIGTPYADKITGSPRTDRVYAGAGSDTISTGDGVDLVYPDGLGGSEGRDVVETGPGSDLVSSLAGRDQISTGRGADFVEAFSSSPSTVDLGPGDDYLGQNVTPGKGAAARGGPGHDAIAFYGSLLAGQSPRARFAIDYRTGVTRASGDRTATGTIDGFERHRLIGSLRWAFVGGPAAERVWAIQGGPLRAHMGGGADQITGTTRDDLLDGGAGTDVGYGQGGKDDCRSVERGDC